MAFRDRVKASEKSRARSTGNTTEPVYHLNHSAAMRHECLPCVPEREVLVYGLNIGGPPGSRRVGERSDVR
jgi:hypothetical protein